MSNEFEEDEYRDVEDDPEGEIQALHDEDYQIQEVLADLVDNSIDADSTRVEVNFEECEYPGDEKQYPYLSGAGQYLLIKDDGRGVPPERIFKALSRGHRRDYAEWELGHFGVGLKDSSFSQAYEITLFSKVSGGEVEVVRYSSCAVKELQRKVHLVPGNMTGVFGWMTETDGWADAMEHMDSVESGTVVLLEGLHKIHGEAGDNETWIAEIEDRCENYLRLAFAYYIAEGGFDVPLSSPDPSTGEMFKHREICIEFNEEELEPLDPFCKDLESEGDNKGTLRWGGGIDDGVDTVVNSQKAKLKVTVFIVPNPVNPDYKEDREEVEEALQSALNVGAQNLQGLFIYRNGRLLDAGGKYPWKGVYSGTDPHRTMLRWEVHLPPGRSVGRPKVSEFRINKSKRDVTISNRLKLALKRLTGTSSPCRHQWHHLDPDYDIGMAKRARIRVNKEGKDPRTPQQIFGYCRHCDSYKHETAQHQCSACGTNGHERTCLPSCDECGSTDHETALHPCSFCGDVGHEATCRDEEDDPGSPPAEPPMPPEPLPPGLDKVIVNATTAGDPIRVDSEGASLKIEINRKHRLFDKIVDKITGLTGPQTDEREGEPED